MKHVSRALLLARAKHREKNPLPTRRPRRIGLRPPKDAGPHAALYRSKTWRRLRAAWLADQPLCVLCGKLAQHVDHIRRHEGDIALFLDKSNLQSLCGACHSRKSAAERRGWRPKAG